MTSPYKPRLRKLSCGTWVARVVNPRVGIIHASGLSAETAMLSLEKNVASAVARAIGIGVVKTLPNIWVKP